MSICASADLCSSAIYIQLTRENDAIISKIAVLAAKSELAPI